MGAGYAAAEREAIFIGNDICVDFDDIRAILGSSFAGSTIRAGPELHAFSDRTKWREAGEAGDDVFSLDMPKIHEIMEKCDNSIVSDRIANFANILGCKMKLRSKVLERSRASYSTYVMVLLMTNFFSDPTERRRAYAGLQPALLNLHVVDFLERW